MALVQKFSVNHDQDQNHEGHSKIGSYGEKRGTPARKLHPSYCKKHGPADIALVRINRLQRKIEKRRAAGEDVTRLIDELASRMLRRQHARLRTVSLERYGKEGALERRLKRGGAERLWLGMSRRQ